MKIAPAVLAAALALALSACGNNNEDRTGDETVGTSSTADATAGTGAMGTGTDAGTMGAADTMGAASDTAGMNQNLAEGDRITATQSAVVLENLIGQFLYSKAEEGGSAAAPAP